MGIKGKPRNPGLQKTLKAKKGSALGKSAKLATLTLGNETRKLTAKADITAAQLLAENTPTIIETVPKTKFKPVSENALLKEIHARGKLFNQRTVMVHPLNNKIKYRHIITVCPAAVNVRLVANKGSKSRGRAFLYFLTEEDAKVGQKALDGVEILGRKMQASVCFDRQHLSTNKGGSWRPPEERSLTCFDRKSLYVTGLPKQVTLSEVKAIFSESKEIDMPLVGGKTMNTGACHVKYDDERLAEEDFWRRNGDSLGGSPILVNFATKKLKCKKQKKPSQPSPKEKLKQSKKRLQSEDDEAPLKVKKKRKTIQK